MESASLEVLKVIGVEVSFIEPTTYETNPVFTREYPFHDKSTALRGTPEFEAILASAKPHSFNVSMPHYFISGRAIFTFKPASGIAVSYEAKPGDLVILPPHMIHSFVVPEDVPSLTMMNAFTQEPSTLGIEFKEE